MTEIRLKTVKYAHLNSNPAFNQTYAKIGRKLFNLATSHGSNFSQNWWRKSSTVKFGQNSLLAGFLCADSVKIRPFLAKALPKTMIELKLCGFDSVRRF
jgi:hypothetical protein